jgi:hypothetical protein
MKEQSIRLQSMMIMYSKRTMILQRKSYITCFTSVNNREGIFIQIPPCDWKNLHCTENHLLRDCPIYKDLQDKEKLDHISKTKRCYNCYNKGHRSGACPSKQCCRVGDCKGKHNTALHYAWKEKSTCVAFLTKNVSPVSLLT